MPPDESFNNWNYEKETWRIHLVHFFFKWRYHVKEFRKRVTFHSRVLNGNDCPFSFTTKKKKRGLVVVSCSIRPFDIFLRMTPWISVLLRSIILMSRTSFSPRLDEKIFVLSYFSHWIFWIAGCPSLGAHGLYYWFGNPPTTFLGGPLPFFQRTDPSNLRA